VALVAALGLALSSTAIALQVFGERNLLRTPSGQAGFSILLFQDVAAIPDPGAAAAAGRWRRCAAASISGATARSRR
jgi:predicted Kef-type K+ transport protein